MARHNEQEESRVAYECVRGAGTWDTPISRRLHVRHITTYYRIVDAHPEMFYDSI